MKCTIDVQPLLGPKSGVAYYVSGLLDGLTRINCAHQIQLSYFDYKRKGLHLEKSHACFKDCGVRFPGRIFSYLWKYINFPSYSMIFGTSDLYHFTNFIIRPVTQGKRVVTIYDLSFLRMPQYTEPKNLKYLERKIGETVLCADRIIVISEFTKSELVSYFPQVEDRIDVIYLGVQQNRFRKTLGDSLELPENFMLYVGNVEPRKNLKRLFNAFKKAIKGGLLADLYFVIVGEKAWLYEDIMDTCEDPELKKRVIFTGYLSDAMLGVVYQKAMFFIYPSLYEGFGLPPLEAMSFELPVIAARSGSLPEVLGDAAIWIDPEAEEDMIEKIQQVTHDASLRDNCKQRGKKLLQKYSWENTARETIQSYEKAIR